MKKIAIVLLTLTLVMCLTFGVAACGDKNDDNTDPADRIDTGDQNQPEYEFIDYAEKVFLNTEKYPELEDQGLFVLGYDNARGVYDVRASSTEGAAMIDPEKPTIIVVHGWLGADFNEKTGYAPQNCRKPYRACP